MKFLRRRLRLSGERGMVLPLALGVLSVFTVSVVVVIDQSSANSRHAYRSQADQNAFVLAEAGINNAMAVLSQPTNNALDPTLLPPRTNEYAGGSVTWSGTLDQLAAKWTLKSVGQVRNPAGTKLVERTLTAKVPVVPVNTQPYNQENWNYIMSTQVTGGECDMSVDNNVEISTRIFVFGNLCLKNSAKLWQGPVVVLGKATLFTQNNQIGSAENPVTEAHINGGCKYRNNPLHDPCLQGSGETGGGDNVWASVLTSDPQTLVPPSPNLDDWYVNGSPGPYFPCQGVRNGFSAGVPPTFDNDQVAASETYDVKKARRNNSVSTLFNLTPSGASYSCKNNNGELTWDHVNKTLYVDGTIFVDGDLMAQFSSTTTIRYEGTAAIYASGSLKLKNIRFCAGVVGDACDYSAWEPNEEMLAFVVNGTNRQSEVATDTSIQFTGAHFQGALYATAKISLDTASRSDGPMVASEVMVGQNYTADDFPTITNVPAGMPGSPTVYAQPNAPEMFSG